MHDGDRLCLMIMPTNVTLDLTSAALSKHWYKIIHAFFHEGRKVMQLYLERERERGEKKDLETDSEVHHITRLVRDCSSQIYIPHTVLIISIDQ